MKDLKTKEFKNIIVRMPNWIGDLVMATPLLEDIKKKYPNSQLTVMCKTPFGQILENDPHVDEIFCFKKVRGAVRRDQKRNIIEKLSVGKYDLGILTTNSFSSAWWFWQGKVQERVGFKANLRSLLLSCGIDFPENKAKQHLVKTYKKLLSPLGVKESETPPKLYLKEEEIKGAYDILSKYGVEKGHTIVGINPGAAFGSAKCWIPERFSEVAKKLSAKRSDVKVVFFGDESTAQLVKTICSELPKEVVNLAGLTSIRELMSLIKVCDVFLTNDSGPMHVGDALEVPLVALFGSTNDVATGPYRQGKVIHKRVECSPCYKRTCPIDFKCMKNIHTEEVYSEILQILESEIKP